MSDTALAEIDDQPEDLEAEETADDTPPDGSQPESEQDDPEGDNPDGGETDDGADAELAEIEFEGKQYSVPKALKDGFLRNKDYTQGKQAVAAERKALEAERTAIQERQKVTEASFEKRVQLAQMDSAIEQFGKLDWNAIQAEDPDQANNLRWQLQSLKEERAKAADEITQQDTKRSEEAKREIANRLQETRRVAEAEIDGWSPEIDAQVTNFVRSQGITDQQLLEMINPAAYKIMHKAWKYDQLQRKNARPASGNGQKPAQAQPLKVVPKGKGSPRSAIPSDKDTPEEWARKRNAQIAKRAASH